MSSLIVPVTVIEKLTPHSNADALELAQVLGWQLVVKKGEYQEGDKIVYFLIDTVLPLETSEHFGVTRYLSKQRIRCAKLRGEPSFGLAVRPDDENWEIGLNVAEHYGATKYEPPVRPGPGDAEQQHPLFVAYTEIENMRNYPDIFEDGEPVFLSEKVHGTQCRVALIEGELMAGSKMVRRKRPAEDAFASSIYWSPLALEPVRTLLEELGKSYRQVILFGEVYGSKIQSFHYGHKAGSLGFRAFDLMVDGHYHNWPDFVALCQQYGVETVPVVAMIPFDLSTVKSYSEGKTLLLTDDAHIREGLVVRPQVERIHPKTGRVILKYVSDSYLFGTKTDYTDQ
ncbi:RNA ligase [Dictyobacter vulcani]|uniref:RNA ligase n=1 Tax=Dictyobacter vulcani TaxID=2607529 RepID=A0A5J4KQE9_9CHLR|nr:RNA ligase (ATP) [Dictyobacter vulcani]GER91604.1 RNA ligase [Dictyobacter vulcani]